MKIHPLSIRSVLETLPPVLDFVLPGLLAGSVGTVVGSGGIGKTTFLLQLAMACSAKLSEENDIFCVETSPARVVYIAAEESRKVLSVRLHAIWKSYANADVHRGSHPSAENRITLLDENLHLVPAVGDSVLLVKDGATTDFFKELCTFCKGARLVIIDPLRRLHDGDENSSSAMTQVVEVLESLAKHSGAAVLATHHMNKVSGFTGTTDAAGASRGSSALTDAVRWQLNMSPMSDSDAGNFGLSENRGSYLRLDFAKTNYAAPRPVIWLKRLEGGALSQVDLGKSSAGRNSAQRKSTPTQEKNRELIYV